MSRCWPQKSVRWEHAKGGNGAAENNVPEEWIEKDFEIDVFLLVDFWIFTDVTCIDAYWEESKGV